MSPLSTPHRRHITVSIASAVFAAIVFLIDVRQAPGLSIPVLYVIPVLLSLWQEHTYDTFVAAAGCTVLTAVTLDVWRDSPTAAMGLANRGFIIVVLWATAGMVSRYRRAGRDVAQLRADQQRADQAARLSDARVRAILDTAVDAILVIDTRGRVLLANQAVERLFGYRIDEVVGQNVSMLMPSPDRERHDGYLSRYLATGERHIIGVGREVVGRRKDGTTMPLSLAVSETTFEGTHTFTGILHDLTAIKAMEAEAHQRAELARLGRMASVVAHEVRNPLAGIRGVLEVLQSRVQNSSRDGAILGDLITRIDALNEFVGDLLVFSRPKPVEPTRTPLAGFFEHLVALVQHDPQFQQVEITIDGPDLAADLDPEAMQRAFLNVLQNAAQAMNGSGRIRITLVADDHRCRIEIADNGPGIPAEARERLFDPFFTTRHGGTGLGLAITRRAVQQHHGSISIESAPGEGTTVVVSLPLSYPAFGSAAARDAEQPS